MGLFKSYREIGAITKELEAGRGGQSQSQQALARLQEGQQRMAAAAQAMSQPVLDGTPGSATIIGVRDSGQSINMQSILQIDMVVVVAGRAALPLTRDEMVPSVHLARARVGAVVPVSVGAHPTQIALDWARAQ
jgi:hypothetical protein